MQALKKGDVICLYCPEAYHCNLYDKNWVKVYQSSGNKTQGQIVIHKDTGIRYHLASDNYPVSCTSCPSINKFEIF